MRRVIQPMLEGSDLAQSVPLDDIQYVVDLGAIALFALVALWYVRRLPTRAEGEEPAATAPSQQEPAVA